MDANSTFDDTDSSDDGHPPLDDGKKRVGFVGLFRSPGAGKTDPEDVVTAMPRSPRWAIQERRPIFKRMTIVFIAVVPVMYVPSPDLYSEIAKD